MRSKWFGSLALAAMFCAASGVPAAEEEDVLKSGLQPGEKVATSFKCRSVSGPDEGKPLCYV